MLIAADEEYECATAEQFRKTLAELMKTDCEIWIGDGYPTLAVIVCGNEAALNYFKEENGDMYASVGDLSRDGERTVLDYEIAEYQLVSAESALESALKFYENPALPTLIEWEEL